MNITAGDKKKKKSGSHNRPRNFYSREALLNEQVRLWIENKITYKQLENKLIMDQSHHRLPVN